MLNFIFARDLLSAFGLNQKKINTILAKETDDKLEELLAEEETIQECKSQNPKLIEFICKRENLRKLIHYATRTPEDPNDHTLSHKYPFVAADILASCAKIAESFIEMKEQVIENTTPTSIDKNNDDSQKAYESYDDSKIVQQVMQKVNDEQEKSISDKKETFVEDINEIEETDNNFEQTLGEGAQSTEQEELKEQRNSFNNEKQYEELEEKEENEFNKHAIKEEVEHKKHKDDDQIEANDDSNLNVDHSNDEGDKPNIQISSLAPEKINSHSKNLLEEVDQYDYTMIDELFGFFEQEQILPILCGYFNKILQNLLAKAKNKMLLYLLIKREGDIFNILLNNLQHHSLAQLLIELLQLKIGQPLRDRFSSDFDSADKRDDDDDHNHNNMSQLDNEMNDVHNKKRQDVIYELIVMLSNKNKDFESCMNAHAVLQELTENNQTYAKLIEKQNITHLIECTCDLKNPNQGYAANIVCSIIKEFSDYERNLSQERVLEFQQQLQSNFNDTINSCLLTMRASDLQLGEKQSGPFENQANAIIPRMGYKRLRALELIRQILQQLSKYPNPINAFSIISPVLRKNIVYAMLDTIEEYQFSSIACQQALLVLDLMKITLQDDDIQILKAFIKHNLNANTYYSFESGRRTTQAHLATIIKMGMALKKMTIDDENTGNNTPAGGNWDDFEDKLGDNDHHSHDGQCEHHHQPARSLKHLNDPEWEEFCHGSLAKFEEKWTKKLEDYDHHEDTHTDEGHSDSYIGHDKTQEDSKEDEDGSHDERREQRRAEHERINRESEEIQLVEEDKSNEEMIRRLENLGERTIKKGEKKQRYKSMNEEDMNSLKKEEIETKKIFKDDVDTFYNNQYWRVDFNFLRSNVDELIKKEHLNEQLNTEEQKKEIKQEEDHIEETKNDEKQQEPLIDGEEELSKDKNEEHKEEPSTIENNQQEAQASSKEEEDEQQ